MVSASVTRAAISRLLAVLLLLGLAACGGTEVGDPTQISITDSRDGGSTLDSEITIGGWVDKTGITTDPGSVTWQNEGSTGTVPVTVVCFIICEGRWKATVPLGLGTNTISVTYFGASDSMTITRFLAFKISGNVRTQNSLPLMSPDVVVTRTDAALSEVIVRLDNKGHYETVAVPGNYSITPKVTLNIPALCLTFSPPSRMVDLTAADMSGQDFVTTHPCYSISGNVNNGFSGRDGIKITIEDTNGNVLATFTEVLGSYNIHWLKPGTYTISPSNCFSPTSCDSFIPASRTVTITSNNLFNQDFRIF